MGLADNTNLLPCLVQACLAVATAILLPANGKPADVALLDSCRCSGRCGNVPFARQYRRWLWSVLLVCAVGRCYGQVQVALWQHGCARHRTCRTTGHGLLLLLLLLPQHCLLQAVTALGVPHEMCRRSNATQHRCGSRRWCSGATAAGGGPHKLRQWDSVVDHPAAVAGAAAAAAAVAACVHATV